MSDLLSRLRALRGDPAQPEAADPSQAEVDVGFEGAAAQLAATVATRETGVHLWRRATPTWRHGDAPVGDAGLGPLLRRWAEATRARAGRAASGSLASRHEGAAPEAPEPTRGSVPRPERVLYLDTETTGLAGGTGTYAFLVGIGVHDTDGFSVTQLFMPGPQHEPALLDAVEHASRGADAVVTYNGAGFDLPLLRNRFLLHGREDPFAHALQLDLLPLARRLWRERLVDCTLGTVEREILGARRDHRDVPGAEVPARYAAFLRSRDARPLRGVLRHNQDDVVALAAMRARLDDLLASRRPAAPDEAYALGRLLARIGEEALALQHFRSVAAQRADAAWEASLLLRRTGRREAAREAWQALAQRGHADAWVALAKDAEHRTRDLHGALAAVQAARCCDGPCRDDLDKREARLRARLRVRGEMA